MDVTDINYNYTVWVAELLIVLHDFGTFHFYVRFYEK